MLCFDVRVQQNHWLIAHGDECVNWDAASQQKFHASHAQGLFSHAAAGTNFNATLSGLPDYQFRRLHAVRHQCGGKIDLLIFNRWSDHVTSTLMELHALVECMRLPSRFQGCDVGLPLSPCGMNGFYIEINRIIVMDSGRLGVRQDSNRWRHRKTRWRDLCFRKHT